MGLPEATLLFLRRIWVYFNTLDMKVEIRTFGGPAEVEKLLKLPSDIITSGAESCVHKFMLLKRDLAEIESMVVSAGKEFRVAVPPSPQSYFDRISEAALGLKGPLALNDLAFARYLRENGFEGRLLAGHGIVQCGEACPWIDEVLAPEDEFFTREHLTPTIAFGKLRELLKQYDISGIEVDALPRTLEIMKKYKGRYEMMAQADFIPVAVSRSCHTARFYGMEPPNCSCGRDNMLELELRKIYNVRKFIPRKTRAKRDTLDAYPHPLYILGNSIYWRSEPVDTGEAESVVDGLIFRSDLYISMDELEKAIEHSGNVEGQSA